MEISQFFAAIKKGDRSAVESALEQDADLAGARDSGLSAVLTAAYYGQPEIVDLLVRAGAPLNLFEASAAGHLTSVLEILDQSPEEANAFAPDGFQPLGLAAFFGRAEIAKALLERGADPNTPSNNGQKVTPLNSAAAGRHLEIARMLLEAGADPNARQADDFTPLHSAAQNGQIEMVRLLLSFGADPNAATTSGVTPWKMAQDGGYAEIAEMLTKPA